MKDDPRPDDRTGDAMSRRDFLRLGAGAALGLAASGLAGRALLGSGMQAAEAAEPLPDVVVAHGGSMAARLKAALRPLGGMGHFVKRGAKVVLKPNAAFADPPQLCSNTSPDVVAAVIDACKAAGAGSITIIEHCLSSRGLFATKDDVTGMTDVAQRAGVELIDLGSGAANYQPIKLGSPHLADVHCARLLLDADAVINLPRLKNHPQAKYTISIKNLMGTLRNPSLFHKGGDPSLVDNVACLGHVLQPHITVNIVDATDLVHNWAAGGSSTLTPLGDLIAGVQMVSVDGVGVSLFGDDPLAHWKCAARDSYLRVSQERGWGVADPKKLRIARVKA